MSSPKVNYRRSRIVVPYMFKELVNNAKSKDVLAIKLLNDKAKSDAITGIILPGRLSSAAAAKAAALLHWKKLVKGGARWDHKPILRRMLSLKKGDMHFPIEGNTNNEYFYDIWSNIHYGYVGMAAGFTQFVLQKGHQMGGSAGHTDPFDIETVQLGLDLWGKHGLKLTQNQFRMAILSRTPKLLKIQGTAEYKKAVGAGFQHITPITDGQ